MWSFARQQRYDFCPRAFYFRYNKFDESFSTALGSDILQHRAIDFAETSRHYFLANLAKEIFYDRPASHYHLRKMVFRRGQRLAIEEEKMKEAIRQLQEFVESKFFLQTNPCLVVHQEIELWPTIMIADQQVRGAVHLAWIDSMAKLSVVKISQKATDANISFAVLYAMKKFHVSPEKINVGVLSPKNWECDWLPIDWHLISQLQEQALSFNLSEDFANFPPTEHESKCQVCAYGPVCSAYTTELDLY